MLKNLMEDCSILENVIEFDGRVLNFSGDKKNIIVHNLDIKKVFPKKKLFLEEYKKRSSWQFGIGENKTIFL